MSDNGVTEAFLRANPLPQPEGEVDKDARGRVVVVGGHREVPGAALLAGLSALRAGAGKLLIATVESQALAMGIAMPEARVVPLTETSGGDIDPGNAPSLAKRIGDTNALLLGPGLLDDDAAGALAASILDAVDGPRLVLDAAALTGMRHYPEALRRHAGRVVLTPHAGEMATFLDRDRDAVIADPVGAAREAAALTGAVVVMKGSCTHIASPQGQVWQCAHGNVGLATSGSGDTLGGIIAGLLARSTPPLLAAQWGVFMHGEAGQRLKAQHGLLGYLAREIPDLVPRIMADLAPDH